MPTIIALDVSLSMIRNMPAVSNGAIDENVTYHQLAVQGIKEFLSYLTKYSKHEYVALVCLFALLYFTLFVLFVLAVAAFVLIVLLVLH